MNYEQIVILIGVFIGILFFRKTKPNLLKGILISLILSFILPFIQNDFLISISFLSFGISSLLYSFYSGLNRKWLNLVIGFFAFVSFVFKMMHYPFANELKSLMLIPIICYITIFISKKRQKEEVSILTILTAYELSEFLKLIEF